jgi:hypothetical protein
MNIVSTMVGMSLMAGASPMLMTMAISPAEAMKRAENFGVAETAAVVFAATYESKTDLPPTSTDTCTSQPRENTLNAYSVTCTYGSGKYVQSVTRAFRLAVPDTSLDNNNDASTERQFEFETPTRYSGHQCPIYDAWGTKGYNDLYYEALGGACTPDRAFSQTAYQLSHPDEWLYDIQNFNGWGLHPDY